MLGAHAKVRQPEPAPRLPHVARLSPSHAPEFSLPLLFLIPAAKIARAKPPHPPSAGEGVAVHLKKGLYLQDPSRSHARFEQALLLGESREVTRGLLTPQIIKSTLQVVSLFLQI